MKKWIALALCLLMLFSLAACSEDTAESATESVPEAVTETAEPTTEAAAETAAPAVEDPVQIAEGLPAEFFVGDTMRCNGLQLTYMACGEFTDYPEYTAPEDGNKFVFITLYAKNVGEEGTVDISSFYFQGYADGYEVESAFPVADLTATLTPGRAAVGSLFFEVPEDAASVEIEYGPDWLSDDKCVLFANGELDAGFEPPLDPAPAKDAYAVGETAEVEGIVALTALNSSILPPEECLDEVAEGSKVVTMEFEVENKGTGDISVYGYDFTCYADGLKCPDFWIGSDLAADLSAGRKGTGAVAFAVPADAATVEIEYADAFLFDGRVVFSWQA